MLMCQPTHAMRTVYDTRRDPLDEIKRTAQLGLAFGVLALLVHIGEWIAFANL